MQTRRGAPRKLTDSQIQQILQWHLHGKAFRQAHGTRLQLAQRMGTSVHTLNAYLAQSHSRKTAHGRGRPRSLTDQQLNEAIAWQEAYQQYRREQGTQQRLGLEMGVSLGAIQRCILSGGSYLTAPRTLALLSANLRSESALNRYPRLVSLLDCEIHVRNLLMRSWQRNTDVSALIDKEAIFHE